MRWGCLESFQYLYGGRSPERDGHQNEPRRYGHTLTSVQLLDWLGVKLGFDRLLQHDVDLRWVEISLIRNWAAIFGAKVRPKPACRPLFRSNTIWTAALASSLVPATSDQTRRAEKPSP